jgi:hypothetical protein
MSEHSTAYVLIYIRESDKGELFCQVDENDLAGHLQVSCHLGILVIVIFNLVA